MWKTTEYTPCIHTFNTVHVHVSTVFQIRSVQMMSVTVSSFFSAASDFLKQRTLDFHFSTLPTAAPVYILFM